MTSIHHFTTLNNFTQKKERFSASTLLFLSSFFPKLDFSHQFATHFNTLLTGVWFSRKSILIFCSSTTSTNSSCQLDPTLSHGTNPGSDFVHKSEEMRLREHICQLKTIRATIQGKMNISGILIQCNYKQFFLHFPPQKCLSFNIL